VSSDTNLDKIDHIVVVMLENRSFDHMLGYLSLVGGRSDVDGLRPGLANEYEGRSYPIHHLPTTAVDVDPDHSSAAIDRQIAGGAMSGFVASVAATLAAKGASGDPGVAMGYYDATDLPVYDHLAGEFAVCHRWFSSLPGATLPNRLYALAGSAAGSRDDVPRPRPPLYRKASFVRQLDAHDVSWRWYSFDPGTLRLADAFYLLGHHDRFGYVSKTGQPWKARLDLTVNAKIGSFLEDAANGDLPAVSWIDPAFTNFNPLGWPVNDDHPPADVADGQDLVLAIYDALASSPQWDRSLLIVVYDEHGGFYDHVPPPPAQDDDPVMFGSYGVRVPAIVVSPLIEPGWITDTVFDHTSIIKTILTRFCPNVLTTSEPAPASPSGPFPLGRPEVISRRVAGANHLGELLTRSTPRPAPDRDALLEAAAQRNGKEGVAEPEAAHQLNELQQAVLDATRELIRLGHPPDLP
jgi:phospholipase C